MLTKQFVGCILGIQFASGMVSAWAQESTDAKIVQLEEVVVTAMKRSETLQEIPAAVSAISGDSLKSRGMNDLQAIAQQVPNLNMGQHFGTTLVSIRGVGSIVDSGVTEPTVALYVDGVFLPRSTMATLRAVDLERIEVLRGPQGTLYGRNATGGAVNFVSASPSDTFEGSVNLSTGSRGAAGISGYVSGPLAEGVSARLSGGHEEQDGYVKLNGKNALGGTDVDYVRGAILIEPADDLDIELTARYEKNTAATAYQQHFGDPLIAPPGSGLYSSEPNRVIANQPFSTEVETLVTSATINWAIADSLSLRSITSYVDHTSEAEVDSDATAVDFNYVPDINGGFKRTSESYGQEFNLIGEYDSVDWLVGAFLYHEEAENGLPVILGAVGGPANGLPANTLLDQRINSETDSWSIYGDMTWSLSDNLRLNLGLRFNHEEQDFTQYYAIPGLVGPLIADLDDSNDKVLPKVGVQYDLSDDSNIYAQWSKGFKSGGANLPGGGAESFNNDTALYDPEEIDAYEIGLKSEWFDGAVTWNSAIFYYDYSELQTTTNLPPAVTFVANADAEVYGLETEVWWQATDNLKVNAAATYLHSRFQDYTLFDNAAGVDVDLDNSPVPHSPDYTFNFGADYTIDLGGSLLSTLVLHGDVYHTDDVVLRQFAGTDDTQESYTLVNLSATLSDESEMTRLNLFVNNVTDEDYKQHVLNFGIGFMGNYGPPRTWGLRISQDF